MLAKFFNQCLALVNKAEICSTRTYQFGEKTASVNFYQKEQEFFTRAIAHLELQKAGKADFSIHVVDETLSKLALPGWFIKEKYAAIINQHVHGSEDGRYVAHFELNYHALCLIDTHHKEAVFWCFDQKRLPEWQQSFPFRQILHEFFADSEYCLVHGAGVGLNSSGLLLTAKGGSGKSTTALSCLNQGWQYAGDDFVLINTKTKMLYSLYNVAKLEPHQLERFGHLQAIANNAAAGQKRQVFLYPNYQAQLCNKMRLQGIVLPRYQSHLTETEIFAASLGQAMLYMAPSTVFLLKSREQSFLKLADLCRSLPKYHLHTSKDINKIPEVLEELL